MTAVGQSIYLKVDFGCNRKLCNAVLPALERENFHHFVAVFVATSWWLEMGNPDTNTNLATGLENLFRKLLYRRAQVSEPKLHGICLGIGEVRTNTEYHKEVEIPTGFPLQLMIRNYQDILHSFREQVGCNNGTLALTGFHCIMERHLHVPEIAHVKIITSCVATLHCITSALILLRTKIPTSHNTLFFTCSWKKLVAKKHQSFHLLPYQADDG